VEVPLSDFSSESNPQLTPETPPATQDWKHFLREVLETLGLAVLLFLVINIISARVRVDGISMRPTLDDGEFVLINRLAYKFGNYQRGDIIVFRPPMYPEQGFFRRLLGLPNISDNYEDYIKRIIGLPGDTVRIENGVVHINGVPLLEPYIAAPPNYPGEWTVPAGNLFVLGDNRNNSSDSHAWGFLPGQNILGKALVVYWPFKDWMILKPNQAVLAAP
jgi:signal peptidase I